MTLEWLSHLQRDSGLLNRSNWGECDSHCVQNRNNSLEMALKHSEDGLQQQDGMNVMDCSHHIQGWPVNFFLGSTHGPEQDGVM